jgi:hypothetical protein
MIKKILTFAILLLLSGCNQGEKEKVIEEGSQPDTIVLSVKEHTFSADGGSLVVTTEGTQWIIEGCNIDSIFRPLRCDNKDCIAYDHYEDMKIDCNSFGPGSWDDCEISKIEYVWVTITKETLQKIVFNVSPNETGKLRKIGIHMVDRNFGTLLEIDQLAE